VLGTIGYLLTFHNFRIRQYDHMVLGHHPHLNGPQRDAYQPMSPREFLAASWPRQLWERFVRSPNGLSFFGYAVVERWWKAEFFPPRAMAERFKPEARRLQAGVIAWMAALAALAAASAAWRPGGFASNIALELTLIFFAPVFVFQSLQAMVLYVQHTHPEIPWFGRDDPLRQRFGPESLTVRIGAPRFIGAGSHDIMEHPAHHVIPAIPCYRLFEAQSELARLMGPRGFETHFFALGRLAQTMRTCKLYDFERHCWTDFSGRATAHTAAARLLDQRREAAALRRERLAA
jgi:omega-6 fatty acid desaturase (delta-12 desaturase)